MATRSCPLCSSEDYFYVEAVTTTTHYEIETEEGSIISVECDPNGAGEDRPKVTTESSFLCKACGKTWPMLEGIQVVQREPGVDNSFNSH